MHQPNQPDWGDFLKTFAVTCVILQTVLTFVLTTHPTSGAQTAIAKLYAAIKFTAPAFICGILYTTNRILPNSHLHDYPRYIGDQGHALYLPALLWTLAYLIIYPQLQQHGRYTSIGGFLWRIINGNAAPHLWYSTMMLQFIAIMPLFWALANWIDGRAKRAWVALIAAFSFEWLWFVMYDRFVFHGPAQHFLYGLDRIFPSFILSAVLGTVLWLYHSSVKKWILKILPVMICAWLILWQISGQSLARSPHPLNFSNLPYYRPLMMVYNVVGCLLICGIGELCLRYLPTLSKKVHWIAVYAFRAFLSHAFWLETVWLILGPRRWTWPTWLLTTVLFVSTILLAFISAYGFHVARLLFVKRRLLQAK